MSMILFACVVRVRDGLPLSASTDFYHTQDFLECRRRLKTLALRLAQYPGRGSAEGRDFNIQGIQSQNQKNKRTRPGLTPQLGVVVRQEGTWPEGGARWQAHGAVTLWCGLFVLRSGN
uniref:SEC22 homolog C, vesicle trafficking protein n=1 Tax=Equus caballus TaxID=9796 RepID=A0A9L0SY48_HORSE